MRLYVNENEIDVLEKALIAAVENHVFDNAADDIKATALYQRADLCAKLQHNIKRSRGEEK